MLRGTGGVLWELVLVDNAVGGTLEADAVEGTQGGAVGGVLGARAPRLLEILRLEVHP